MTAKTATQRSQALRAAREAAGIKRLDIYAHTDDHAAIKELAAKLEQKRAKSCQSNSRAQIPQI